MNAKVIVRVVLLAVVAFAVGSWAVKEFGSTASAPDGTGNAGGIAAARSNGITVINFHGKKRCRTCLRIGELSRKTVEEEFAAEKDGGKVRWEEIDYEEPANAGNVGHYELVSSTVVVTLWMDGKEVKWIKLDGVWDHVDDEAAFRGYVAGGVRGLLQP